jgi:hypothetical protein
MTEDGDIGTTEHSHGAPCPLITHHTPLITKFLIYGSAIRSLRNPSRFSNLQFSNRR